MRGPATDALLALSLLCCWIGVFGAIRLRSALGLLHGASFITVAGGFFLILALWVKGGEATLQVKATAFYVALLFINALTSHAVGRAIYSRDGRSA